MIAGAENVLGVTEAANAGSADISQRPIDLRKRVSIVMIAADGTEEESGLLHTGILAEFLSVKSVDVDPGRDEITQISGNVSLCFADSDFSDLTQETVQCIVDNGRNARTDYELIVGLKADGGNYSASFLVVENTTMRAVGNSRASGSLVEVRDAANQLIHRIFGPTEETKPPAPDLALRADPTPPESPDTFVKIAESPPRRPSFLSRWKWPVIFGGFAAATAAAGAAFGFVAKGKEGNSFDATTRDDAFAAYNDARNYAAWANGMFITAGVLAAGTLTAVVFQKRNENR